ncbi:MAG TPA: TasA family protein [Mycobacteriales bacterium]|nr:TasA family protein [Mycobacteriales bacterium]
MRLSRKVKVVAALGTLSGAVWASTYATFSDSATSTSTFTAGSVDLTVNAEADDDYAFTSLESSNLKPGDVKYAPLTVANVGTLAYGYTMSSSSTNADSKALRDTLRLGAKLVANAAACDSAGVGYLASLTTVMAEGAISSAAISSRSVASGSSEVLCFKVELPSSAGDALQSATTTTTMTFTATQS